MKIFFIRLYIKNLEHMHDKDEILFHLPYIRDELVHFQKIIFKCYVKTSTVTRLLLFCF